MKTQIFDDILKELGNIKGKTDAQGLPIILLEEPVLVLHPEAMYALLSDERLNYQYWNPIIPTLFGCEYREDWKTMKIGTWKFEVQYPLPGLTPTR